MARPSPKLHSPPASSDNVRHVMRGNRKIDTRPETRVRAALHARGLRFRKNVRLLAGDRWVRPDVAFSRHKVAVFVDGCFWHRCPTHGNEPGTNAAYWEAKLSGNVARDRADDAALKAAGWVVVRVWEHEEPSAAADRVAGALRQPGRALR